jgi:multidrug efflux pump
LTHISDEQAIQHTRNSARYFTEYRHIGWVLMLAVFLWGWYGYSDMPKRKDPDIPISIASVVTPWPGKTAEEVEQLITVPIEQTVAENTSIRPPSAKDWGLNSTSLPGVSIVQVRLADTVSNEDKLKQFSDINLKLNALNDSLPPGAGPIQFNSGFSDTAQLALEVVSPRENKVELSLRARDIRAAIVRARRQAGEADTQRAALVIAFPRSINASVIARTLDLFVEELQPRFPGERILKLNGAGFAGLDVPGAALDDTALLKATRNFLVSRLGVNRFHPDAWSPIVVRDPDQTLQALSASSGDKYSYRELDDFSNLIVRNLLNVQQVSKASRSGTLPEQIYLAYSQEELASYGIQPEQIQHLLNNRNIAYSGGVVQTDGLTLTVEPSGQFTSEKQIGDVVMAQDDAGLPVYLRSLMDVHRGYQYPPRYLNYHTGYGGDDHTWQRHRAVAVGVFMRDGNQLGDFQAGVTAALDLVKSHLPEDLIIIRASDQAEQAEENTDLFTTALYEAIIMVVLVALAGFRDWRSALLMLLAIPTTMAMTFGFIDMLGIDVQQVSIVALIIALGLLVDDPVVASDAIKRNLAAGHKPIVAAWLGPTRLANAIMFATITNVAAYLPLLLLTGDIGHFLYSLPVVMVSALVASRIVSMTFVPLLGYYLLRPAQHETDIEQRRQQGFTGWYYRVGKYAIDHRKTILALSVLILVAGGVFKSQLVNSFFPDDVQYLSYADIWLRNDATLQETEETARQAVEIIRQVSSEYASTQPDRQKPLLESVSTYLGGSGPKFWFSVIGQTNQLNYAQLVMRVTDKDATPRLTELWQTALNEQLAGASINVKQLQTQPVNYPVGIRIASRAALEGDASPRDIQTLRRLGDEVKTLLQNTSIATQISDDWGEPSLTVELEVDPDRASLAGVSSYDVAYSSALANNGVTMTELREGDNQIPVVTILRPSERARLSDLENMYVYASDSDSKVPLGEVARFDSSMLTSKINRIAHFRTLLVYAYPLPGMYASQIMDKLRAPLSKFEATLPPGYQVQITGTEASANDGNSQLKVVLIMSILLIYIALVVQFKNAVKPLLVFAAVPYGVCGAFAALYAMNSPFGFMAFLGIVALIGVIVSHVIVLFDFVEEAHERGEALEESLLDAGIVRLRPVLITVGATIAALIPLALHGGPLWQPLCYAQIGGLLFATFVTLLLVPVFYSVFVLDLKIVKWQKIEGTPQAQKI